MSAPYAVSFIITVDDVVGYLKLQQRTLNRIGVTLGLVALVAGAAAAVVIADLFMAVWFGVIGLIFLVSSGTDVVDRWRVRRGARSLVGSKASFTLDDEGISADTITGTGSTPWSSLTQLLQSERMLLIKRDRVPIAWIPTRAFASADELHEVVQLITSHVARTP